jgi:hypothetical protein
MPSVSRTVLLLLVAHAAWAQYVVSTRAGVIHYVEGQVTVDGRPVQTAPLKFPMLQEGQVLRTGNGRAEVLLGPGVFLRLGEHGGLRMLDTRLENAQVEVQQGTALVEVVEMPQGSDLHVVLGPTRTGFKGIGLHRFEAGSNQLRVYGGHAQVFAAGQIVEAGRGRVVHLGDTLSVSRFDARRKDALHQWAARRSFLLYRSTFLARAGRSNWEVTLVTPANNKLGLPTDQDRAFFSNRDFDVMFSAQGPVDAQPVLQGHEWLFGNPDLPANNMPVSRQMPASTRGAGPFSVL